MCCVTIRSAKTIGILTSGSDSPGKNAVLYNLVRTAIFKGVEVHAVVGGFKGLIDNRFFNITINDVRGISKKGGSIITSLSFDEIKSAEGLEKSRLNCEKNGIDALIAIGGDRTLFAIRELSEIGVPSFFIPSSIHNDAVCSDYSIGFESALSQAVETVDRLKDSEQEIPKCDVVEVMGSEHSELVLNIAAATEAVAVLIPEIEYDLERDVVQRILYFRRMGKTQFTVVVSGRAGNAGKITDFVETKTGIESFSTVLGRTVFGGNACSYDRIMANKFAAKTIELIEGGEVSNRAIGLKHGQIVDFSLGETKYMTKTIDRKLYLNTVSMLC